MTSNDSETLDEVDPYKASAIPGIVLTNIFAGLGIFGNVNIVWATCRKSQLQGVCHVIIAITALSDILHQSGHFLFLFFYLTKNAVQTTQFCFWLQLVPSFNISFGAFMVLSIGIDRLIRVLFPMAYLRMNKRLYIFVTLIPPFIYSSYYVYLCYPYVMAIKDNKAMPILTAMFIGETIVIWNTVQAFIHVAALFTYTLLWLIVKKKSMGSSAKRMIKSLCLIMVTFVSGWVFVGLFMAINQALHEHMTPTDEYFYHFTFGWLINVTLAANYWIYFVSK
ncbi:unnamed protein product [Bursaphelenchus okinawaensis]|uniref:G-protein coupled receptors family 1 profile domain-containing protein n=1 Tax=Bursaphelenchus okinawaensis TaxID=465554 RepID=A0A811LSI4_9BILA|nr:unnamed protein product [Bursaphelenchus okinawaensis]CAG9127245.1 unnamed protein product [Bursaphelenchus okinawaensis]